MGTNGQPTGGRPERGPRPGRRRGLLLAAAVLALVPVWGVEAGAALPLATRPSAPPELPPRPRSAGNGILRVRIDGGEHLGAFSVTTGPDHPKGAGLPLLSRSRRPGSSFLTLHSYDSDTDYNPSGAGGAVSLAASGTVTPLDTTGFRTTYEISGADRLRVVEDVVVVGTTLDDSSVVVTTRVTNTGFGTARVGLRHLWDLQLLAGGAPRTSLLAGATETVLTHEQSLPAPQADLWQVTDTTVPVGLVGSLGPGASTAVPGAPLSTPPDLAQYVSWPAARRAPFRYDVSDPGDDPGTDTALLTYWGGTVDDALVLPQSGSRSVSAFLHLRGVPCSTCGRTPPRPPPFRFRRGRHHVDGVELPAAATDRESTAPLVIDDADRDATYGGGDLLDWTAERMVDSRDRPFLRLSAHLREEFGPRSQPWQYGTTTLQWHLDVDGAGDDPDYLVRVMVRHNVFGLAYRAGDTTPFSTNLAAFHDDHTWGVDVPLTALGDPSAVRAWAGMAFQRYPFLEDPPVGIDVAPERGWSPLLVLDDGP